MAKPLLYHFSCLLKKLPDFPRRLFTEAEPRGSRLTGKLYHCLTVFGFNFLSKLQIAVTQVQVSSGRMLNLMSRGDAK
jgi:hypothetical protein